jgi:hypothetical protein
MYEPLPVNTMAVNPFTGALTPITSESALILFSSPEDNAAILPLVQALDPNMTTFDGAGRLTPPLVYGSDGRTIMGVQGTINGLAYQSTVGILIAQKNWGSMWNGERQQPYTKLFADAIDPTDAQLNWGH